nr:hypothetical protein CFP56_33119 [Quercus suber]
MLLGSSRVGAWVRRAGSSSRQFVGAAPACSSMVLRRGAWVRGFVGSLARRRCSLLGSFAQQLKLRRRCSLLGSFLVAGFVCTTTEASSVLLVVRLLLLSFFVC